MIKLDNITKTFTDGVTPLTIFSNLNLEINKGEFTAILGRSGGGKSTLLNIIGLLDKPSYGNVIIDGTDVTKLKEKQKAIFRNQNIGFIFQSFLLEESLSVIDNVTIPLAISGINREERVKEARVILDKLGILEKENEGVYKLSGGQKQRVCIARALITNPSLILADEPTGQLDYENGQDILKILKHIVGEGKTVILVTHNEDDARKYADNLYLMKDGVLSPFVR